MIVDKKGPKAAQQRSEQENNMKTKKIFGQIEERKGEEERKDFG